MRNILSIAITFIMLSSCTNDSNPGGADSKYYSEPVTSTKSPVNPDGIANNSQNDTSAALMDSTMMHQPQTTGSNMNTGGKESRSGHTNNNAANSNTNHGR